MQGEYSLSAEQISKLLHDLRAPVANAKGFKSELNEAVAELSSLMETLGPELPDKAREQLTAIINDDILLCSDMLASSVDVLHERVKEFDQLFPATGG